MSPSPATLVALEKERAMARSLQDHMPLAIAFSGGVDSTYLLAVAVEACGDQALGVIADSPSLPRAALAGALEVAAGFSARVEVLSTEELENADYASNPPNRCYFCKAELFSQMDRLASERGWKALAYGENADDALQLRPGARAATEYAVIAPLREHGLTKAEIRELSRLRGLPTADAPSQPCLSSRIPHGTPVTPAALKMVESAEAGVRALGFQVFRVRHMTGENNLPYAKLQLSPEEAHRFADLETELASVVGAAGYSRMDLDPKGYQSPLPHAGG